MSANNIILKEANGENGFRLCSEGNTLTAYRTEQGRELGEPLILGTCAGDFDAVIDGGNNIHILFADNSGGITYIQKEEKWSRGVFLAPQSPPNRIGSVFLFRNHLLFSSVYTVLSAGKNLLFFRRLNGESPKAFEIDTIDGESCFAVDDPDGNILIFYNSAKEKRFGFKKFIVSEERLMNFRTVSPVRKASDFSALTVDGKAFICYKAENEIRFRYLEYRADGDALSAEKTLTSRYIGACTPPFLQYADGAVVLYRTCGNRIYSARGESDGKLWRRLTDSPVPKNAEVCIVCDARSGDRRTEIVCAENGIYKNVHGNAVFERHSNTAEQKFTPNLTPHSPISAPPDSVGMSQEEIEKRKAELRSRLGIIGGNDNFDFNNKESLTHSEIAETASSNVSKTNSACAEKTAANPDFAQISDDISELLGTVRELKSEITHLKNYLKFISAGNKRKISAKQHKKS